jgi:hypothetical protein
MVILKFLCVVPKKYKQMAKSIESLLELRNMSIEELTGRLKVYDEDDEEEAGGSAGGGKLLLTKEQWMACSNQCDGSDSSGCGGSHHTGKNRGRDGARNRTGTGNQGGGGTTHDD